MGSRLGGNAALNALIDRSAAIKKAAAISPNDTTDLTAHTINGIWVGVTGDIKTDLIDGGTGIIFKDVPVGVLNIDAKRIYATGTTATNLIALL